MGGSGDTAHNQRGGSGDTAHNQHANPVFPSSFLSAVFASLREASRWAGQETPPTTSVGDTAHNRAEIPPTTVFPKSANGIRAFCANSGLTRLVGIRPAVFRSRNHIIARRFFVVPGRGWMFSDAVFGQQSLADWQDPSRDFGNRPEILI